MYVSEYQRTGSGAERPRAYCQAHGRGRSNTSQVLHAHRTKLPVQQASNLRASAEKIDNALGLRRYLAEISKSAEPILPLSWTIALIVGFIVLAIGGELLIGMLL